MRSHNSTHNYESYTISVIVPHKDRPRLLERALQSVALQSLLPLEVVVIDDGSTAENLLDVQSICERFGQKLGVKLLVNSKGMGANFSRNRGILEAAGEYLAFLDSDDAWLPEKIRSQVLAIDRATLSSGEGVLCYTGRYRTNQRGEIIARQVSKHVASKDRISFTNSIGTLSSVVVDRVTILSVGGFDESLTASQDWDLYIRVANRVKFIFVSEPLCIYFDHQASRISNNSRNRIISNIRIYRKYVKGKRNKSRMAELYRILAEDLQVIGKKNAARRFYLEYLLLNRRRESVDRILGLFSGLVGCVLGVPDIKKDRYSRYRSQLARFLRTDRNAAAVSADQAVIAKMHLS